MRRALLRRRLRPPARPIDPCGSAISADLAGESIPHRPGAGRFSTQEGLRANPLLTGSALAPPDFPPSSAVVYEDAASEEEVGALVNDLGGLMRRRRYERGHWDSVISLYREVELPLPSESPASPLSESSALCLERIRSQLEMLHFGPGGARDEQGRPRDVPVSFVPCHGIDLKKEGELMAHVDSVRYSGLIVAGLSLLSSTIMRLRPAKEVVSGDQTGGREEDSNSRLYEPKQAATLEDGFVDLYLPPRSLYVLSGPSRYQYTHELLPCGSHFRAGDEDVKVVRDRRISVIFRDAKQ